MKQSVTPPAFDQRGHSAVVSLAAREPQTLNVAEVKSSASLSTY